MHTLEEAFPDHKPLLPPAGTPERQRAEQLMRLERRLFSEWLGWLCRCVACGVCTHTHAHARRCAWIRLGQEPARVPLLCAAALDDASTQPCARPAQHITVVNVVY